MRILCLNLQTTFDPSCAEIFLKLSPRVQFRYPCYVFVDIESTSGLFGGEFHLLKEAVGLARKFSPQATAAIANTPYLAQVLAHFKPFEITTFETEQEVLSSLPLSSLIEMEGLSTWSKISQIEHIISFFQSVGMHGLEEILKLSLSSFRERWGETGVTVWKRLHGRELQVVSPLITQDPLMGYAYFDDPVDVIPILMQKLEPQIEYLFLRLEGLSRFAQNMTVTLHCEYSEKKHKLQIEPVSPNRDKKLYIDLLIRKLEDVDLENPIRELEVHLLDVPEKVQQLDFFEEKDTTDDRWRRLISFARQSQCEIGFLQIEPSHFPEEGYSLKTDWPEDFSPKDLVEKDEDAIQVKSVYAKMLAKSPRPSLLLNNPLLLSKPIFSRLKVLTRFPAERIDSSWWKGIFQSLPFTQRDYYFAVSREGQLLWVFQDRQSRNFYLHGYFD